MDCSICFYEYNETDRRPMVLPCGHTFCYSCMCDIIRTCRVCPQDRTPIRQEIQQIPPNFELILALDNIPRRQSINVSIDVRRQKEGQLAVNQRTSNVHKCKSGHFLEWNASTCEEYKSRGYSHVVLSLIHI